MTSLRVLHLGDPRLRDTSSPIVRVDDSVRALADAMVRTMHDEEGVGLAAPQVNHRVRLVVLRFGTEHGREEVFAAVNPELSDLSEQQEEGEEGCLSVPYVYGPVRRSRKVTMRYQDLDGRAQERKLVGFDARIIQHEVDHLNGVLFIDRVEDKSKLVRVQPGDEPKGAI